MLYCTLSYMGGLAKLVLVFTETLLFIVMLHIRYLKYKFIPITPVLEK